GIRRAQNAWGGHGGAAMAVKKFAALKSVLGMIDALLPNSVAEEELIRRLFGYAGRSRVVPNAVDEGFLEGARTERWAERFGRRDFVLATGNISDRKNTLGLVRAMRGTGLRLVVAGPFSLKGRHGAYYERCRREGGADVFFAGPVPHDEIGGLMLCARVHAQPSWFETPGLASLEAALAGCSVVVSTRGPTREYFGDEAHYCEPDDVESIRGAVVRAFGEPPSEKLRERVRSGYNWRVAAGETRKAYEDEVGRRGVV
ncbi:MAG: glycosyltransferase family 4 protein, partial [bacterium]